MTNVTFRIRTADVRPNTQIIGRKSAARARAEAVTPIGMEYRDFSTSYLTLKLLNDQCSVAFS